MKRFLLSLLFVLLGVVPIAAQTQQVPFFARFVYDDGTAVTGQLAVWDSPQQTNSIFTGQTDPNGRIQGTLSLDPTNSGYTGQFSYTNPQKVVSFINSNELPVCNSNCAGAVLAVIPTGEIVVTIKKANGAYSGAVGPLPPIIASLTASATTPSVVENGTDQINATAVCGTWGCNTGVTWTASSGTITSTGLFTAPGTLGVVTVTAASMADPTQTVSVSVTVTNPLPTLLPQTLFASCVSTPAYGTAPNPTLFVTDDGGGGQAAGYIVPGQKFDCTGVVPAAGTYLLNIRAESPYNNVPLHFEYPVGTTVASGVVNATISAWGVAENWATFSFGQVTLPAGTVTVRVVVDATTKWQLNLNWFN